MACPSPKNRIKNHFRSISLPAKLSPTNQKIDDELNRLGSWSTSCSSTSASVLEGLSRVEEVYISLEELLHTKSAQQVLGKNQHENYIEEVLEGSVKILDACSGSREIVGRIKEHLQSLQSMIRRRKVGTSFEEGIASFSRMRKTAKKDARRIIASLKQLGNEIMAVSSLIICQDDDSLLAIIRVLREVNLLSIPVFQFLLAFLTEPRPDRWSVISRMIHKQEGDVSELERVNASLRCLCKPGKCENVVQLHQKVQKQLADLESNIGNLENSLECVFRRLIKGRASLLNILSQ